MSKLADLTGQRFGRLVVLERSGTYKSKASGKRTYTQPVWLCKCDCGQEAYVLAGNLRRGNTRSCGCIRSEMLRDRSKR